MTTGRTADGALYPEPEAIAAAAYDRLKAAPQRFEWAVAPANCGQHSVGHGHRGRTSGGSWTIRPSSPAAIPVAREPRIACKARLRYPGSRRTAGTGRRCVRRHWEAPETLHEPDRRGRRGRSPTRIVEEPSRRRPAKDPSAIDQAARRVTEAASAAIAAGVRLSAIADAESDGELPTAQRRRAPASHARRQAQARN